jgi:hypothetical protein
VKSLGNSVTRRVVDILLLLAAVNLVLILLGAYFFSIGGIRFGHRLIAPLELVLALILIRTWLQGEKGGFEGFLQQMTSGRLFLVTLFVYLANGKTIGAVDTLPAKYLPFSLLREANFDFDEFSFLYLNGIPGYLTLSRDHYVSFFPPFAGVIALPIYAVSALAGVSPSSRLVGDLEKVSASVITALSVAILFLTLRRLADKNDALLIATVYAFGSSTFSISAQALWQHGPQRIVPNFEPVLPGQRLAGTEVFGLCWIRTGCSGGLSADQYPYCAATRNLRPPLSARSGGKVPVPCSRSGAVSRWV